MKWGNHPMTSLPMTDMRGFDRAFWIGLHPIEMTFRFDSLMRLSGN